jgi:hypothetical protein
MKKANFIACIVLIVAGIAISFCGLFAPPLGAISPSVIEATGIFLVIAGGFAGLVVDFDFKHLRFFVGLPEQYEHSQSHNQENQQTQSSTGNVDAPE